MSSTASAVDHIDHVTTQLPYVMVVGAVAVLVGFLPAGLGLPWYLILPLGFIVMYLIVRYFGKSVKEEDLQKENPDYVENNQAINS